MGDSLKLKAPWEQVKERLKENNTELTDEDLNYSPGNDGELLDRLASKLKKRPEEVKALVESISANDDRAG